MRLFMLTGSGMLEETCFMLKNHIAGDLISRKAGENIDGYPFLVGIYTLLRQVGRDNIETFVSFLSAYMKSVTLSK